MMRSRFLCLFCLSILASAANATDTYSVKTLLMEALISPSGRAAGIVVGKEADTLHSTTGAYDPVRGEVSTIKRFKQEGCSRLALMLIQPNTPTKQGSLTDFKLYYELNLCKNGRPPLDASQ